MIALNKKQRSDLVLFCRGELKVNNPLKRAQLIQWREQVALASLTAEFKTVRLFGDYGEGERCWVECDPLEEGAQKIYSVPPVPEIVDIESDIKNIIQLLSDREWAENCTSTELGKELESKITDLHNEVQEINFPEIVDRSEIAGNEVAREWFLRGCDWYEKEIKRLNGLGE